MHASTRRHGSPSRHPGELQSTLHICLATALILALGLTLFGCGAGGVNPDEEEPTTPAAPSGLEASSGDGLVQLEWSPVDEADAYNVYRSTSSTSGVSDNPLEQGVVSASYVDLAVQNGTTYYYRVTAVASQGEESNASGEAPVTPFDEPPARP